MKKISFLFMVIILLGVLSCGKDGTKVELKSTATAPVLDLTEGTVTVLKKADAATPIIYTWTSAEFGAQVIVTYTLQMAKKGSDFADPLNLGIVTNIDTLVITTDALNSKLLGMEPDPTNPTPLELEFRVQASISTYSPVANSPVVSQTITPYYVPIIYPILFVPGSYQGWNPADSSTTIASVKSNGKYEGYLWFDIDNAEYKYTETNNWDNNWGDNGADGTLEKNGANILAGSAGYYKLNADLSVSPPTHAFLRTTWGIVGDAVGSWDVDKLMSYDPVTKVWTATLDLTAAGMKFRANASWDLNYGDTGADGTLEPGGDNIMVPAAGNYTVTLNLSKPVYRYQLKQN